MSQTHVWFKGNLKSPLVNMKLDTVSNKAHNESIEQIAYHTIDSKDLHFMKLKSALVNRAYKPY